MRITEARSNRRERGSQLVELALLLPVLVLLVIVIGEGAAMVRTHVVLNNAAREGARLSSLHQNKYPITCDTDCACDAACVEGQLKNAVVTYATQNGVRGLTASEIVVRQDCQVAPGETSTVDCSATCSSGACLNLSMVSIDYPFTFTYLPRLPGSTAPAVVTLRVRSQYRNMY